MAFLDNFLPYLQLPPTMYGMYNTITFYTLGHLEISWEVFAQKSADILSFRNSFITQELVNKWIPKNGMYVVCKAIEVGVILLIDQTAAVIFVKKVNI